MGVDRVDEVYGASRAGFINAEPVRYKRGARAMAIASFLFHLPLLIKDVVRPTWVSYKIWECGAPEFVGLSCSAEQSRHL